MTTLKISAYEIPCDSPESDGTIAWSSTVLIFVSIHSEDQIGIGYSYGHESSLNVIKKTLSPIIKTSCLSDIPFVHQQMVDSLRNDGVKGIAAHALSAVDIALWDLKAKTLATPLCKLWGKAKDKIPIYGSGGFTSYSDKQTCSQFEKWKKLGIKKFKMKVGRNPSEDLERVKNARQCLEDNDELFVDANGAYTRKGALEFAEKFHDLGVTWFEEPVSANDLEGLRLLRDHTTLNITAGEYGYDIYYFKKMLEAQSVDIIQADASRCCGYTGFFQAGALSKAFNIPLSSHTAPSLHLHACLSHPNVCHMEFFHDHARIEETYFEGFPKIKDGCLIPHLDRYGHGLELKTEAIQKFLIREDVI